MSKYELQGIVILRTVPRNSDIRVAIQDGNVVDHLDIWLQRRYLVGKKVKITVEEI